MNIEIGVKSRDQFMKDVRASLERAEEGIFADHPKTRIFFQDSITMYKYLTPKRLQLAEVLYQSGAMSINALAKLVRRSYKNVYDDVTLMEAIGLVRRTSVGFSLYLGMKLPPPSSWRYECVSLPDAT